MRMLLLMGGLCASLTHAAPLPQGYLEFEDYRFTEEHQYGYGVSLWHDNGHLRGVLFMSAALQGDVSGRRNRSTAIQPGQRPLTIPGGRGGRQGAALLLPL